MNVSCPSFKVAALVMAIVMAVISAPSGLARAGLVETETLIGEQEARGDRARVRAFLLREDVQAQMVALGVPQDEALARVDALSDLEVRRIAGHLEALPAGQIHGIAIGVAVLIFVVLVITDILGYTDIFPFIKKAKK